MTTLWLSIVRTSHGISHAARFSSALLEQVAGVHVDIHVDDSPRIAAESLRTILYTTRMAPYDVHFIDDRPDAADIVDSLRAEFSTPRHVYAPTPQGRGWAVSVSASSIIRSEADQNLLGSHRVLVSPPPRSRELSVRLYSVAKAIDRVRALACPDVTIVLDRDVDERMAFLRNRRHVAEVVVGKAILDEADSVRAARLLSQRWNRP